MTKDPANSGGKWKWPLGGVALIVFGLIALNSLPRYLMLQSIKSVVIGESPEGGPFFGPNPHPIYNDYNQKLLPLEKMLSEEFPEISLLTKNRDPFCGLEIENAPQGGLFSHWTVGKVRVEGITLKSRQDEFVDQLKTCLKKLGVSKVQLEFRGKGSLNEGGQLKLGKFFAWKSWNRIGK